MFRLWFMVIVLIPLLFPSPKSGALWAQDVIPGADDTPVVVEESPLAVEPVGEIEQFEAAVLMSDLGRMDLAKKYLESIVAAELSDKKLLELRDRFGTVELVRLSRTKELLPASQQLLDQVADASMRNAFDPTRIDKILSDLEGAPREREVAISELNRLGAVAMPRLIQRLASEQNGQSRDQIVYLFSRLGNDTIPALMAALESDNNLLKTSLLSALGVIGNEGHVPALRYYAFSKNEVPSVNQAAQTAIARILYEDGSKAGLVKEFGVANELRIEGWGFLNHEIRWQENDEGMVDYWVWDPNQSTSIPFSVTPESANLRTAVHLSKQALSFNEQDPESQAQYLAAVISEEAYRTGTEEILPYGPGTAFNLAMSMSPQVLEQATLICVETEHPVAADALFRALSLVGDQTLIYRKDSPIQKGLNHPDLRVQFAAAASILELRPETPFRNSSRVVEILSQAVLGDGHGEVLMIDPNRDRGQQLGVTTRFPKRYAATGKEGFLMAAARSDVRFVMTHVNCIDWELSQTLANFRADARTAHLPIIIYGPTFLANEIAMHIQRIPNTHYVIYTDDTQELDRQLKPFLTSVTQPPLTPANRAKRAQAAVSLLAEIGNCGLTKIFPLDKATPALGSAINDDELATDAFTALTAIPSKEAQDILSNVVLSPARNEGIRTSAALALSRHIRKYGVLISMNDAADIKTSWMNATDPAFETALTTVVATFHPSPELAAERLREFSTSPYPVQP